MQIGSVVFGLLNFSILIILKMKLLIAGAGFIVQDWLQITKDLSKVELTGYFFCNLCDITIGISSF